MKKEQRQFIEFLVRLTALGIFCSLYAIGGSGEFWGGQLWLRRWLGPFIICLIGAAISRDWRAIVFYPAIGGFLTLPYGADFLWEKIALRFACGLTIGAAFNGYNLLVKDYGIAIFGIILATVGSIYFGAFNPWPNAMIEQAMIAHCYAVTYIFSVRRKIS